MFKIGINGFGRIGRIVLRARVKTFKEKCNMVPISQILAVNDPFLPENLIAFLLKHGSTYGKYKDDVRLLVPCLTIDGTKRQLFLVYKIEAAHENEPKKIPWLQNCVNYVIDATGVYLILADLLSKVSTKMGVVVSYLGGNPKANEPDPVTGLTPKEKELVTATWAIVKKDLVGTGVAILALYFRNHPEHMNYFPFKDLSIEELPTNPKFKAHAASVMYALAAIIDNLNNNDVLVALLTKNGESHAKRGIHPISYEHLKETILECLQKALAPKFSKDDHAAWEKTITVAFTVILDAADKEKARIANSGQK